MLRLNIRRHSWNWFASAQGPTLFPHIHIVKYLFYILRLCRWFSPNCLATMWTWNRGGMGSSIYIGYYTLAPTSCAELETLCWLEFNHPLDKCESRQFCVTQRDETNWHTARTRSGREIWLWDCTIFLLLSLATPRYACVFVSYGMVLTRE